MCEFKVYLDGTRVFNDTVYVKADNGQVTLKSILGETKQLENCQIVEVNVTTEKILLSATE